MNNNPRILTNTYISIGASLVLFLSVVLPVLLLFGCSMPETTTGRNFPNGKRELYILYGQSETVSVITLDTTESGSAAGAFHSNAFLTGQAPNDILYYNGRLFIVNSLDNTISVLDEKDFSEIKKIYVGSGKNPYSIIRAGSTAKAYVPNYVSGTVTVINLNSLEIEEEIKVENCPESGSYADGKMYICNTNNTGQSIGPGSVSVIDPDQNKVVATISTEPGGSADGSGGTNPQTAFAVPGENQVHIICTGTNGGANSDDGEIVIIDTDTNTVSDRIAIGGSPAVGKSSIDRENNIAYLTGVGGIQAYNYQTKEVLNSSENYLYKGSTKETFFSGAAYDSVSKILYVTDFTGDRIIALQKDNSSADFSMIKEYNGADADGPISPVIIEE